ncbi:MAG: Lrp/AsnC family transcriptional regulator [Halosimplex sp.]
MPDLDELDCSILRRLQEDARNTTPVDMAAELPVSAQTVRNRIENLEEEGVIEGYVPLVDYERAGFPIRISFTCTAPVTRRSEIAERVLDLPNVVSVEELLSANENLRVLAVTPDSGEITPLTESLVDVGLTIESERLVDHRRVRPFEEFCARSVPVDSE